jgi:alpha-L-rhamnosidase
MKRHLFIILLAVVLAGNLFAQVYNYPKAILPGDYPDPTVVRDGRFYPYYPAAGTNRAVWADDIRGTWSKPVDLKLKGIDPGHMADADGKRYLYVDKGYVARPSAHLITPEKQIRHGMELSDDFNGSELGLQWTFWKEYAPQSVSIARNTLSLEAKGTTPSDARKLLATPTDKTCETQVEIETGENNRAGLMLFYNEKAFAGIVSDGEKLTIFQNAEQKTELPNRFGRRCFLKILNRENICSFSASSDNRNWIILAENIDVSGLHHNNSGGFYALRIALISEGEGKACFKNFVYSNAQIFGNARWIGGSDAELPLYAQYLTVFRINFMLQLNEQSTKAGFIYGANDMRLLDKYKNIYHIENEKDSSYILAELDVCNDDKTLLNIYRAGYSPDDKRDIPLKTVDIPRSIINPENKFAPHQFSISSVFGNTQILIDNNKVADLCLNPLGKSDVIAFPALGDIGWYMQGEQPATLSCIEIGNYKSPSNLIRKFDGRIFKNFEIFNPSQYSAPLLRTRFNVKPDVANAKLYITARGIYVPYLNGKRIGNDYFNPGHTQYNKTLLYQTYDVTGLLQDGENSLSAQLGEGWWSGNATYASENWNCYGDRNSLLAKLIITYSDGKEDIIVTDPETWEYTNESPVIYGSLFQGEVFDATVQPRNWKPVVEISLENHVATDGGGNRPKVNDYSGFRLIGQFGQTVQPFDTLTATAVEEARPKVFVYDMGQNMVGVPRIVLPATGKRQQITFRYAEVKYPDLPEYKDKAGEIMLENIRGAMAQDIYLTNGNRTTFQPEFTFHGYRFIEITGVDRPLPIEDVQGIVLSSIDKFTAHYETSNSKVNRLWENIKWSMLGNFLSIPADCPQRNERMGWSGDISVFSRTATYMADVRDFLRRHLLAMRDVQREDGRFADVAPMGGGFGGLLWGSAGITVAWESFRQYGDTLMLREHYPAMKRYIDFVLEKYIDKKTGILIQENPDSWANLGDWLGPEQEKNDNSLLWESYFLFDLDIMGKIARDLGKTDDERYFTETYSRRKAFFNDTYIDRETGKTVCSGFQQNRKGMDKGKWIDTQTSYVLPLAFGIVDNEHKAKFIENFATSVERENVMDDRKMAPSVSLLTGFIGTAWINKALSDVGRSDLAYRLLQQTTYPSWLYPVEQGATTIWERLNSYTHENGFGGNNGMNSFNHYSFGAVGAWMIENSLGVNRDENATGFNHFVLRPEPDPTEQMTFARGHYDSPSGRIESGWEHKGNETHYRFVVPQNATATLYLSCEKVTADNKKGVKKLGVINGKQAFELRAGEYNFVVIKDYNL